MTRARGVALAGAELQPTILVNTCHHMKQNDSERRFTLAYELCHILHDRGYGRRLSLTRGPWAPVGVEKRANAFAAILPMPPELADRQISSLGCPDIAPVEAIEAPSCWMGSGFMATLEHLADLGKLDEDQRDQVREGGLADNGAWWMITLLGSESSFSPSDIGGLGCLRDPNANESGPST